MYKRKYGSSQDLKTRWDGACFWPSGRVTGKWGALCVSECESRGWAQYS